MDCYFKQQRKWASRSAKNQKKILRESYWAPSSMPAWHTFTFRGRGSMVAKISRDLVGHSFGMLTVIYAVGRIGKENRAHWLCRCDCGKTKTIMEKHLISGATVSCGCYRSGRKHGLYGHKLYPIWNGIIQRCTNPSHQAYPDYGGRGITVCSRWLDVSNFIADMEAGHMDGLTIDRIDNNDGYHKNNCRWVDQKTQCLNKRTSVWFEYKGKMVSPEEMALLSGIKKDTLLYRRRKGLPILAPVKNVGQHLKHRGYP